MYKSFQKNYRSIWVEETRTFKYGPDDLQFKILNDFYLATYVPKNMFKIKLN